MPVRTLVVVVALLGACSERTPGGAKRFERDRDAAAVVIVERPGAGGLGGPARTEPETEPNDEPAAAATALALPVGVTGVLDGAADRDVFRVEIGEPGALRAAVGGIDGVDLVLDFLGADGKQIARCDNGPARTSEGFPNLPVEPGVYYLAVSEFTAKKRKGEPRTGPSPQYRLVVERVPDGAGAAEREPNDTRETAGELAPGAQVEGYVGWARDEDVWKLALDGLDTEHAVDIDVTAVPGIELQLAIVDGKGGAVLARGAEARGQGVAIRGWVPGGEDPSAHYLIVKGKRSSFEVPYRVLVTTRALDAEGEWEPNDAPERANPLASELGTAGGSRRGHLPPGDVDVFAVPVGGEPSVLDLEITPGATRDLEVAVIAAGGVELASANAGGKGAPEKITGVRVGGRDRLFVRVRGASKGAADDDDPAPTYTLSWSLRTGIGPLLAPPGDDLDDVE